MWNIQGRLGSKRRMAEERNTTLGTKAHWGRDRTREDSSRLGDKKGTGSMLPARKEGTLYE